jgi:hypothetical protein
VEVTSSMNFRSSKSNLNAALVAAITRASTSGASHDPMLEADEAIFLTRVLKTNVCFDRA